MICLSLIINQTFKYERPHTEIELDVTVVELSCPLSLSSGFNEKFLYKHKLASIVDKTDLD